MLKQAFLAGCAGLLLVALSGAALAQAPAPSGPKPTTSATLATLATLKVGEMAPDFTLPGTDGKTYKLSDFRGQKNVLLAFYVLAFTGG